MSETQNLFKSFDLSPDDTAMGKIFNSLNLQGLHNLRTEAAEQKLYLFFDVNNPQIFIQKEAHLRGQIDCLTDLIDGCIGALEEAEKQATEDHVELD